MNIMFQVGSWHYDKGGTDLFVKTISNWLAKKGHKIVVLAHRLENENCGNENITVGKGIIKVRYTPKQKSYKRFNPLIYGTRLFTTSLYLYKLAKKEKIDVLITGETELLSAISLKLTNTKVLCRGGALMYETMKREIIKQNGHTLHTSLFLVLLKFYNNLTLKIPDILVPVNASEYKILNSKKRKSAIIKTIPHGIPLNLFKPKNKTQTKKIIVGYVGRLAPIKYPETVLQIFKDSSRNLKNTEFHWIGPLDPSFKKDYFENLKHKLKIKNAKYLGQIKNEELPKYLSEMDVFLQAEQQTNVSRSTTEAAACGIPIVALNIGKEPYGFFTTKKQDAINELAKLLRNKTLRLKEGKKARAIIEKEYSEDKIYQSYLSLLEKTK